MRGALLRAATADRLCKVGRGDTPTTSIDVEARISKSGQAVPQAGNLYSAPQTVKVGTGGIKLRLDQVRQ